MLQSKNERIKQLEQFKELYDKRELEDMNKKTYEQLRKVFKQKERGDSLIVISDDELSTDKSANGDISNQESFLSRYVRKT